MTMKRAAKTESAFLSDPSVFVYLVLAISVLLVYWQVREFAFVSYDDDVYVYQNAHVPNGLTREGIVVAFTTAPAGGNWMPLTWLSFMLDCQLFGLKPGPMHLVNVLWHLVNTLLLFALLKKITGAFWPSAFVAAAFALHPMHVESVAWITERKDVLSMFFLLVTVWAYAGYVRCPSVLRYGLTLVLFGLGLMAKPMLVTLPFVLLLLDYWPLNRFAIPILPKRSTPKDSKTIPTAKIQKAISGLLIEKIPFLVLAGISSAITFAVQRAGGSMLAGEVHSLTDRMSNACLSYVRYIGKLFWPQDLAVLYPFSLAENIPLWQVVLSILLLGGITGLVLFLGRRQKYLPVGWFWFLGTLVPVIGLVHVGPQAYADRYTYIPYTGLFVMIFFGVAELAARWRRSKAVIGLSMLVVLTALGWTAHRQTGYWRNSEILFSRAVSVTDNNYMMYNNLGAVYNSSGRHVEALKACQEAVRIKPAFAAVYNNLGIAYSGLGRFEEAIKTYQQGLDITPHDAELHYNLGVACSGLDRYEQAIAAYQQSIKIKPHNADASYNMGIAYGGLGQYEQAIEAYEQTLRIRPNDAVAYNNLGIAYGSLGRLDEAIKMFQQANRIRPDYADAHLNLAIAYLKVGDNDAAMAQYKVLKTLNPAMAETLLKGMSK